MITISKIQKALGEVKDPTLNKDLISLGCIQNIRIEEDKVFFDLLINQHIQAQAQTLKTMALSAISALEGVANVEATLKTVSQRIVASEDNPLKNIKNIIAISSCKGGVGKSTVASKLAISLKDKGHKVGLIDADIYGPSIPTLFNVNQSGLKTTKDSQLIPVDVNGLKIISFGFLLNDGPAIFRGPIVTRYVQQLLMNTQWGELDYLLIDLPPGTGDVHLTITQTIQLTGAVIITTPHTLSLIDVARGIIMFEKVNVPIIGLIENMAYFKDPASDTKHYVFGQAASKKLKAQFGVNVLGEIPIDKKFGQISSEQIHNSEISLIADELINSAENLNRNKDILPNIYSDHEQITLNWPSGKKQTVRNFDLRLNSQDALSVNEMTGEKLLKAEDIREDIAAKKITPLGNYAIGVEWNDGHTAGIYPYALIDKIASSN